MALQGFDYAEIPAPSGKCIMCEKDLAEIEKHPSVLEVDEKGTPERRDICAECWAKIEGGEFVSFWLTQREKPKPDMRRTRAQQREALRQLFEKFVASGDKRLRVHIYVMAHVLMKHRLLQWEGSERGEDGVTRVLFRHPVTEDRIAIEEVDLTDDDLVAVKREIETALAVGEAGRTDETDGEEGEEAAEESPEAPTESTNSHEAGESRDEAPPEETVEKE